MPIPASSILPTLDDVKAALNIEDTSHDAELQDFLDEAVELVEQYVGPLDSTSVTETHYDVRSGPIVLNRFPVLSVESIVDDTSTAYSGTYTVSASGLLRGATGWSWPTTATVTYTVGRTDLPGPIRRAILEVVRDMWAGTQSGGGGRRFGQLGADGEAFTAGRPALPPYAREMLEPYLLAPAVA